MPYKFLNKQKIFQPPSQQVLPRKNKRADNQKLWLGGFFLLIIGGLAYFILWSGFWRVKHIEVSGTEQADLMVDIVRLVDSYQQGFYYRIIPKSNIFFLKLADLSDKIKQEVLLDDLRLSKKLPDRLLVYAQPKKPVLVWQSSEISYYVDKEGKVMSAKAPGEIKYDLPLVSSSVEKQVIVGRQIIDVELLNYLRQVWNLSRQNFDDWYITKIVLADIKTGELHFYSNLGWYFILNLQNDQQTALNNLALLLKQKANKLKGIKYIDLRFEDKIFYK